jgi:hypothetical protein
MPTATRTRTATKSARTEHPAAAAAPAATAAPPAPDAPERDMFEGFHFLKFGPRTHEETQRLLYGDYEQYE